MRKLITVVLAGAEVAALIYVATVTWLLASWFVDDAVAASIPENNWYRMAVLRVIGSCLVAIATGAVIYAGNRYTATKMGHASSRVPYWSAVAFGLVVALAGIAGAVQFAIEKPYM